MFLSIIIPTLNEAENMAELLPHLRAKVPAGEGEIIVCDGGSADGTLSVAQQQGADQALRCPRRGRAAQMNHAAQQARGEVLYFVHADTRPPATFWADIQASLAQGYEAGTYRSSFDCNHLLLRVNAFFTRFDRLFCRGGDQSIYLRRDTFEALGGYREDFRIMEDFDLIRKLRKRGRFHIQPKSILISARKYDGNSYFRVNVANLIVVLMYQLGASQESMVHAYRFMLSGVKNS